MNSNSLGKRECMRHLFYGGVHPEDKKSLSSGGGLQRLEKPKQVVIPMQQHIGVVCTPLVAVGDVVKKGQKIGDGEGLCVPVHASVSGKVIAVEPRRHPKGDMVLSVVIENDFQGTLDTAMVAHEDYSVLSKEEIIDIIREAGIVGMGGATFSTSIKSAVDAKIDTLIANACECEPYITADDMLLRTNPKQVIEGMKIIAQVVNPERMVLAIEDNKKEAIKVLKEVLENEDKIELRILPTRYPQGAERQLVQAVTGKEIIPGQLPPSVGCVVFNVATYEATYRAVCLGKPVTGRIVTVTGEAVKNPANYVVPMGISMEELIQAAGGLKEDVWKVINGGPMMGQAQPDLSAPVIKGTNAVLCLSNAQNGEAEDRICIRCGKCLSVCPTRLQPLYLYAYAKKGDVEGLKRFRVNDCMECGSCAYECPGKLPLVEQFRLGKVLVREGKKS